MRLRRILLIAAATLSACNDIDGPRGREISPVSGSQVRDARNGGVTGFYFLPPIAPAITYTGAFDAKRSPVVLICRLEDAACTNPVARLTGSGSGTQRVRVSIENEHYGVEWSTRGPGLLPGATYRVRVLDGATELGYADVRLLKTDAEAKALPSGIVGVVFGSTLAIKFRVEVSTVGPPVNATLGAAGGTVRVPLGAGGIFTLEVPAGALDAEVAFTITPRAPIAGKLASVGIAPANVLFAQPARISLSLPTTVVSTLGKPAFVLGNGSFPLLLATDAVEPGRVFSARLPMLGDLPSFLRSQTATRVGYAMNAAAEPSGDAIDLVIADAQQVITAFLAAAADLDSKRSFTSAIKYRMEAAALAQWAGLDDLATEAIAAGQASACAKLDQVTGLAPTSLGTEFRDLWKALEPVLAWTAAAQSVGLTPQECPPLAAFQTRLSELVADFVTLYTAAMERSRFPSNAEGLQDQIYSALLVRKYGFPLGMDADFDRIKALIQRPLAQRYRRAAYDFCRSDNSQHLIKEVFLAARDSVMYARNLPQVSALGQRVQADDDFGFDAAGLSDDLQLCGTAIVVTSEDAGGNRTLEGGIGGTSIPGQPERSLDIDANAHGKIELEGTLIAFRCGEDVGNDVINVDFNGVRVRTWTRPQPTAHFIVNETKKFDVDSLAMVAGLDANGGGTFPLTLSREGNACGGSYSLRGAGTSTLLATINVKFPKIAVSVAPTTAALAPGENKTFTATVTGAANTDVTWTVTGGSYVATGNSITYTAGPTAGLFTITATSVEEPASSAEAQVNVVAPPAITLALTRIDGGAQSQVSVAAGNACTQSFFLPTTLPPPGAVTLSPAQCAAGGASASATQRYTSTVTSGSLMTFTASGQSSTSSAVEATRGFTQAYATFDFEVSGGDVSVTLSGQLSASIPDTTSSTEARASFILQRRSGARLVDKQVGGNAGDTPFTTSAPLSGTYRLTPGIYRVNVFATGEAAAAMRPDAQGDLELRSAAGSSNYTFTLTVAP
jgi:hypothetical protein